MSGTENKIETQEQAVKLVQDVANQAAEKAIAPLAESMAKLMEQTNKERDEKAIQEAVQKAVAETEAKHKAEMQAEADRREQARIESQNKFVAPSGSDTNVGHDIISSAEKERDSFLKNISQEFVDTMGDSLRILSPKVQERYKDGVHIANSLTQPHLYTNRGNLNIAKLLQPIQDVNSAMIFQSNEAQEAQPFSTYSKVADMFATGSNHTVLPAAYVRPMPINPIYDFIPQSLNNFLKPTFERALYDPYADFANSTNPKLSTEIGQRPENGTLDSFTSVQDSSFAFESGYSLTDLEARLIANGERTNYIPYVLEKQIQRREVLKSFELLWGGGFGNSVGSNYTLFSKGNVNKQNSARIIKVDASTLINETMDIMARIANRLSTVTNRNFITENSRLFIPNFLNEFITREEYLNNGLGDRKIQYREVIDKLGIKANNTLGGFETIDPIFTDESKVTAMLTAMKSKDSATIKQLLNDVIDGAIPDGAVTERPYSEYYDSNGNIKSGTILAVLVTPEAFHVENGKSYTTYTSETNNGSNQIWTFKQFSNLCITRGQRSVYDSCFVLVAA